MIYVRASSARARSVLCPSSSASLLAALFSWRLACTGCGARAAAGCAAAAMPVARRIAQRCADSIRETRTAGARREPTTAANGCSPPLPAGAERSRLPRDWTRVRCRFVAVTFSFLKSLTPQPPLPPLLAQGRLGRVRTLSCERCSGACGTRRSRRCTLAAARGAPLQRSRAATAAWALTRSPAHSTNALCRAGRQQQQRAPERRNQVARCRRLRPAARRICHTGDSS